MADVLWLGELPRHIGLKYATSVNRWTALGNSHVALLQAVTEGDPARSLLWRDLLDAQGIGDVASVVFPDQHGCWGFLELFKNATAGSFSSTEAAFLADLVAPLTRALRHSQASSFATTNQQNRLPIGPVVLLLSSDLEVLGQTPDTQAFLRTLVPPTDGQAPIPAGAYNVASQLLAVEQGIDSHPASARVHLADGIWVTLRAARIERLGIDEPTNIAVTIEESSPTERLDLFARAFGLSARETELLGYLANGSDTKALAREMFVSQNTVQDHFKSIFLKTGTRTRPALLSRALGT